MNISLIKNEATKIEQIMTYEGQNACFLYK